MFRNWHMSSDTIMLTFLSEYYFAKYECVVLMSELTEKWGMLDP